MNKWLEWILGMAAFRSHTRVVEERQPGSNLFQTGQQAWNLQTTIDGALPPLAVGQGLLVVANHPRGLLELFLVGGWLEEQSGRPVRFLVNRLIGEAFPTLNTHIIGVDNMSRRGPERSAFNRAALLEAIDFMRSGGVLNVCPAGQVASWRLHSPEGWLQNTDHPWHSTFASLARAAQVPIQPIHVSGSTRLRYRFARLFGLVFGRMMNFREFNAGVNTQTVISVAERIESEILDGKSDQEISRLCRERVFSCAGRKASS